MKEHRFVLVETQSLGAKGSGLLLECRHCQEFKYLIILPNGGVETTHTPGTCNPEKSREERRVAASINLLAMEL